MLRRRLITLDITTDEGRPEDWDYAAMLFKQGTSDKNTVKVVAFESVEVK